jgi:peptide-methionine (R)-S-oxide reductase
MKTLLIFFFALIFLIACGQTKSKTNSTYEVSKTSEEWQKELSPDQYNVLCGGATETPFTGKYLYHKEKGVYTCAACKNPLFKSDTKYDSGSGWPSFYDKIDKKAIKEIPDYKLAMKRIEIVCARCGGHLGHVFNDGPNPTGLRYCVNSAALDFQSDTLRKP